MLLGQIVREYRTTHQLSTRRFAELCDLTCGYISMIENEKNPKTGKPIAPNLETLAKLASGMGLSLDELLLMMDEKEKISIAYSGKKTVSFPLTTVTSSAFESSDTVRTSTTAERLNMLMAERNLKQVDILRLSQPFCEEHRIKLGRSDLSQFVSGKTEPGQSKLSILSMALNVSEAWLLGFDVPPERETPVIPPSASKHDLSSHEQMVITAYRDQPEMQPAVCRILGITCESKTEDKQSELNNNNQNYPPYVLKIAEEQGVPPEFVLRVMSEQDTSEQLSIADGTSGYDPQMAPSQKKKPKPTKGSGKK